MHGPDDSVTRRLSCGDAATLLRCSPLAVRCYLCLFWGDNSVRAAIADEQATIDAAGAP